jgi:hypothetical protein
MQSLLKSSKSESSSTCLSFSKQMPPSSRGGMYLVVDRWVTMAGAATAFASNVLGGP